MNLSSSLAEVEALKKQVSSLIDDEADPRIIPRSGIMFVNGKKLSFPDSKGKPFFECIREASRQLKASGVAHLTPARIAIGEDGQQKHALITLLVFHHVEMPHRRAWVRGVHEGSAIPWTEVDHELLPSEIPFFFGS